MVNLHNVSDLGLAGLFAADEVGSKYLTQDENEEAKAKLDGVIEAVLAELSDEELELFNSL
jgi:hypothetical protein